MNIAVSASKDGKLRVVYAGWEDVKVVLESLRQILPGARSQIGPPPPLLVTSGGRGGLSPHRYTSREVLLGPVDET